MLTVNGRRAFGCMGKCVNGRTSVEWSRQKRHELRRNIDWFSHTSERIQTRLTDTCTAMKSLSQCGALFALPSLTCIVHIFSLCFGVFSGDNSYKKMHSTTNELSQEVNELRLCTLVMDERPSTARFPFETEKLKNYFWHFRSFGKSFSRNSINQRKCDDWWDGWWETRCRLLSSWQNSVETFLFLLEDFYLYFFNSFSFSSAAFALCVNFSLI